MSKRSPKSVEEKLEIVNLYLEKGKSISSLIREYGVSDTAIRTWVRKYKHLGIAGLRESKTWTRYSKKIKEQAVQDYLNGTGSTYTICDRYQISSRSVLET
ncbi:helix-turn-helix domain-containing protein [Streptococcus caledonicus]